MADKSQVKGEVYFEITVVGGSARVAAVDAAIMIEVAVVGPARASVADLKRLALGKLKVRIARERGLLEKP
ncbi:MAG: serine hydroxymethyltransferase [Proteobacteria bacterium]|nr:serine hydroxymethyltransferase [Pseudomonadota bacterium]